MKSWVAFVLLALSSPFAMAAGEIRAVGNIVAVDCKEEKVRVVRPKDKGFCVVAFEGTTSVQHGSMNKWVRVNGFFAIDPKLKLQDLPNGGSVSYEVFITDSQITKFEARQ